MKREDIFGSNVQWIENWVQRIESRSGLECIYVRNVWNRENFTKKELLKAQEKDADFFRGLAQDLLSLC